MVELSQPVSLCINSERGLQVVNSIFKLDNQRRLKLLLTNNANKLIKLKDGTVVGWVKSVVKHNNVEANELLTKYQHQRPVMIKLMSPMSFLGK